jgi:hypothetical protein
LCLLVLGASSTAWGHGFSLSLASGALEATSNDFPGNGNQYLFNAVLEPNFTSDHGGAGSSLFGVGKSLSFDVEGKLWFSKGDGTPAVPARPEISLLIEGTGAIEVFGNSVFTNGYAISGNTSHEFLWTLQSSNGFTGADDGVYGIAYRVKGGPSGGGSYLPTPLLVPTFMTPNFFPGNDPLSPGSPLMIAQAAIYQAATVPEPSSIALAMAAALGFVAVRRWRKG